jgi:hypothetical protein
VPALLRGGWRWFSDQAAWCTFRRAAEPPPGLVAWVRADATDAGYLLPGRTRGSVRKRAALRRVFGALKKGARHTNHPARGDGEIQRQLARLERELHLLERRLSRSSVSPDIRATYDARQSEAARLRATLIERCIRNPDGSPVQDGLKRGDVVTWKGRPLLIGRVAPRFVGGFHVSGGADGWPIARADRSWITGIVRSATPALLAALDHREALGGLYGDAVWRSLIAEALQ